MTRYYGAPRDLVTELLVTRRWAPGDVYYACALAQVTGQPCRAVVSEWDRDHGQGWGAIAKRMGIKPGSARFHRLKKGFVPTYDRWARPIRLDDALRVDFPHHGKGKLHGKSSKDSGKSSHAGKAHGGDKGGKATSSRKAGGSDKSKGNSGKSSAGKGKGGNGKGKG